MYESLCKPKHLCSNVKNKMKWVSCNTDSEGKAAHMEMFWSLHIIAIFQLDSFHDTF